MTASNFSLTGYLNRIGYRGDIRPDLATHSDTIFPQKKLAVMQTPTGRKILLADTLKLIENGTVTETTVDYTSAAHEHFGLNLFE